MNEAELVASLADELGLLPSHLRSLIKTAPLRYKQFTIPKKGGGVRHVAQPAREVKAVQRCLIPILEPALPIHRCATGYRRGSSIKQNAEVHSDNEYMLKMDIKAFFPSITFDDICLHLQIHCEHAFDAGASRAIAQVCCWAKDRTPPLRLCIGAPSSPLLSNSILFDFDSLMADAATVEGVIYSRYADDLTFSSAKRGVLARYEQLVAETLAALAYPKLSVNQAKTLHLSRRGRRTITGVTVTPDRILSVGRDRKRLIRAMMHRHSKGELSPKEVQQLNGLIAFADFIEPGYKRRVRPDQ